MRIEIYNTHTHNNIFYHHRGASNLEELHNLLKSNVMIRRLKRHVSRNVDFDLILIYFVRGQNTNSPERCSNVEILLKIRRQHDVNVILALC